MLAFSFRVGAREPLPATRLITLDEQAPSDIPYNCYSDGLQKSDWLMRKTRQIES